MVWKTYSSHATGGHHGGIHLAHAWTAGPAWRGSHGAWASVELGLKLGLRGKHARDGGSPARLGGSRHGGGKTWCVVLLLQLGLADVSQLCQGYIDRLAIKHAAIHLCHCTSRLEADRPTFETLCSWTTSRRQHV